MSAIKNWKEDVQESTKAIVSSEKGAIGYLLAWLLGVPASVLLVIMLFRGL